MTQQGPSTGRIPQSPLGTDAPVGTDASVDLGSLSPARLRAMTDDQHTAAVVLRALAKDPADRYQTASAMAADLARLRTAAGTGLVYSTYLGGAFDDRSGAAVSHCETLARPPAQTRSN